MEKDKTGPLAGVKVVELGGIGPGPFGSMILSDMGAEVLRIDRIVASDSGVPMDNRFNLLNRGRRSVAMDLKKPEAVALVKRLLGRADAVIEGFRPGVAERLGLGPDDFLAENPALVYGRMTGWGQEGPLSQAPGHDLARYIALTGALHLIDTGTGLRFLRSTWSGTSAAADFTSHSASSARSSKRDGRGWGRWSMPPWSTALLR